MNCIMLYTMAFQVAAVLPSNTPVGDGTVQLTFDGQTSNLLPIHVVERSLGIFARNQSGGGPGIIQNFNSEADQPINSILEAAAPGQTEILWGTGLGPVVGDEAASALPGDMPSVPVEIFVGDQQASVTYRGRSGCCVSIDQIVFTVPAGVQLGCYVPVEIRIGNLISNFTTMAIAAQRGPCVDPVHLSAADVTRVQNGGNINIGQILFQRFFASITIPGQGTLQGNVDFGTAQFQQYDAGNLLALGGVFGHLGSVPSLGSCSVYQFPYEDYFGSIFPEVADPVQRLPLDAGPAINVNGPLGAKQIPKEDPQSVGYYDAEFGGINPDSDDLPDYLNPGNYTIDNGAGGTGVPSFMTSMTLPDNLVWTNESAIANIPRTSDLTVTWSGADSTQEFVVIIGSSVNTTAGAGAAFVCSAPANAGSFAVPTRILAALPPSGNSEQGPVGFLVVVKSVLRRTFATLMLKCGTIQDVQAMLRHASLNLPLGTHTQAIPESVKEAVRNVEQMVSIPDPKGRPV